MAGKTRWYSTSLSLTSQVAFCSMPLRLDTYRGCPFQCRYCFAAAYDYSNRHQHHEDHQVFEQVIPANPSEIIRTLRTALDGAVGSASAEHIPYLQAGQPLHWGGVSDPFSYVEPRQHVSLAVLRFLAEETTHPVVVSTKATLLAEAPYYDLAARMKDRLLIQVSILGDGEKAKQLEPAAPSISERVAFVERMAADGFHVLVRIQPYFRDFAESQARLFTRYGAAGVRGVVVEGLKVPGRVTAHVQRQWGAISSILGYDVLAEFRRQGRHTGGDAEYSFQTKLAYGLTLRTLAHRHGLHFYAADNDMRLLGDSPHCCGSEWVMPAGRAPFSGHITALAYYSPQDFGAHQMLSADDPRMTVSLNFLNWGTAAGSANARALYDDRLHAYLRGKFNAPGWVRRVMPQAQVIGPDGNGDMHYRIDPAFLTLAEAGRWNQGHG